MELNKVLISDSVDASCLEILEAAGISVEYRPGLSKQDLLATIKDYNALIVRSGTKVTREVIQAGTQLKLIGRAGTGVDNIDLVAATERGVVVMNTPGGNTISAAEQTCALICCIARNIPQGYASLMAGRWDRKHLMGVELDGKTLGIIGLGRIGREVAVRMQSFGMKTIGYDPLVSAEEAATFKVDFMELEKMWPLVDFVTVHTPLIPQTRGLMNDAVFAKCRRGVRVVNVARGGIIDEDALLRALENGMCGGAGLDVFVQEPPTNRALVEHAKVVGTPHLGASTVEAQLKVAQEVAQQFVAAVKGEGLRGVVNVARVANAINAQSKPWISLATNLGRLLRGSLTSDPLTVKLTLSGSSLLRLGELMSSALLLGLCNSSNRNLFNAKALSSIKVDMVTTTCLSDSLKVECQGGLCLAGALLGKTPVLISINNHVGALIKLDGPIVVVIGRSVKDLINELGGVTEVAVFGDAVAIRVMVLPEQLPEGSRVGVVLE